MKRYAIEELKKWKNKEYRKPLIIQGARQVGKTWLMKEFGKNYYQNVAYISFDKNKTMQELFAVDMDIKRIIPALEIEASTKITTDTLIIFDEIQECPNAITSLKYFYENAPEYHIICAGSLLGIYLHSKVSFPVGKVEFLDLYPLSFSEFLDAMGQEQLLELLQKRDEKLLSIFSDKIKELLKYYFYIGGMPEVVSRYIANKNIHEVQEIQKQILATYERDFSKHIPTLTFPKVKLLWDSIPSQLSKEHKKFVYSNIQQGARAREYENAMAWLKDCGLIYKVNKITKPSLPLKAYEDISSFKLFMLDIGLLSAVTKLNVKTLLEGDNLFTEFKGALTEQYVLQQLQTLKSKNIDIFYWSNDSSTAEIDFIVQTDSHIIPLEVKSTTNLKSKSLISYREKYNPSISIKTSLSDFSIKDGLYNIPLYMIEYLCEILG